MKITARNVFIQLGTRWISMLDLEKRAPGSEKFITSRGFELHLNSSNLDSASYQIDLSILFITYKGGARYGYYPITPAEALDFFIAPSKGEWVWDNLRVRGSKTEHKKAYWRAA